MAMCHLKVMEEYHTTAARELELVKEDVDIELASGDKFTLTWVAM